MQMYCEICGSHLHSDEKHGAAILCLDTGRDTPEGTIKTRIEELTRLFANQTEVLQCGKVVLQGVVLSSKDVHYPGYSDDLDERLVEVEDKLNEIVSEAGYVPCADYDANCWKLYAAVEDRPEPGTRCNIMLLDDFMFLGTVAKHTPGGFTMKVDEYGGAEIGFLMEEITKITGDPPDWN